MKFVKATRKQAKLRLALTGPSGAGKTYSALAIAKHLGVRIAVIDSERGSASKYADDAASFDVLELDSFAPQTYVEAIRAAEREGYDVIVIDSLSHAWMGKGGALDQVDAAAKRSKSGNTFTAWKEVTPQQNALMDAIVGCKAHVIATMRSKTEYVIDDSPGGRKAPKKIGLAAVQRDGVEFEFDVFIELDEDHNAIVSKTRCSALDGAVINKPGEQIANTLRAWLSDGAQAMPEPVKPAQEPESGTFAAAAAEPGANDKPDPADLIHSLVTVDLDNCGTQAQLVTWATALLSVDAPNTAKSDAWKAFQSRCLACDLSPREIHSLAKNGL